MPDNTSSKPRTDPGLKWGISPDKNPQMEYPPESFYTPEQQAERQRLREKGTHPDSYYEMQAKVYNKGPLRDPSKPEKSGFWTKVAGTVMGGGSIK